MPWMREARSTEKQKGSDRSYRRKEFKSAVVKVAEQTKWTRNHSGITKTLTN